MKKSIYLGLSSLIFLGAACSTPAINSNSAMTEPNTTFSSPNLEYTIAYPVSWFSWTFSDLYPEEFDSKEQDSDFFATQDHVSVADMEGPGAMLTVSFTSKKDPNTGEMRTFDALVAAETVPAQVTRKEVLNVGPLSGVRQFELDPRDPENTYGYVVTTYLETTDGMYMLQVIATNEEEYHQRQGQVQRIIDSFRVN